MNRKILIEPDPILRKKCEPLEKVDDNVRKLMKEMLDTMYKAPGIGLAAIQIGVPKRIIVLDVSNKNEEKNPMCFINPKIKKTSDERSSYEEGCLSIPNTFIQIERPKTCIVEFIDLDGKKKERDCDGLLSTCIQHECNHLDGKLIIDFLSLSSTNLPA